MRIAMYCRVSTADQTTDNQAIALEEVAQNMGWEITDTFTDVISGAKTNRHGLDALMDAVKRKQVDMAMGLGCISIRPLNGTPSNATGGVPRQWR